MIVFMGFYLNLSYLLRLTASCSVQFSVYMMIFGALVAASEGILHLFYFKSCTITNWLNWFHSYLDLAFNLQGYTYISLNNILTASNGVFLKKKLDAKDLGKNGLLFYNSLFMIPLALVIAGVSGDLHKVEYQ